jgi:hypothetical protein
MSNGQADWWDRNLAPGSKRFLAWSSIVAGTMSAAIAPFAILDHQWLTGLSMGSFGGLMILESVLRLRRIPRDIPEDAN